MTYIPDCRKDDTYNEKNLTKESLDFIHGFDMAVDEIMTLFDNTDVFPEFDLILDPDIAVVNKDKIAIVRAAVKEWAEMSRNEVIVALIDRQEDEKE